MMLRKDEIEEKNRYIGYQKTVSNTLPYNLIGLELVFNTHRNVKASFIQKLAKTLLRFNNFECELFLMERNSVTMKM